MQPLYEIQSLAASDAGMDDVTDKIKKKTRLNSDSIKYITKNKTTV